MQSENFSANLYILFSSQKLCNAPEMTPPEFFDCPEFLNLEQEIK